MKNKLFIHIGPGKTGSSFLQSEFARKSDLYRSEGLIYPDIDGSLDRSANYETTSGNGLLLAVAGVPKLQAEVKPLPIRDWRVYLNEQSNYLLSSEWFSFCDHSFFEDVERHHSHTFDIFYIAFIRDIYSWIISRYFQALKVGTAQKFEQFFPAELQRIGEQISLLDSLSSLKLFNYDQHKEDLLSPVEQYIFGKTISPQPRPTSSADEINNSCKHSFKKIVNPSPSVTEASTLWLCNELGLADFYEAMKYLEHSAKQEYSPKLHASNGVLTPDQKYTDAVKELVQNLPVEIEKIFNMGGEAVKGTPSPLLQFNEAAFALAEKDIEFVRERVAAHCNESILNYIRALHDFQMASAEIEELLPNDFDVISYLTHNPDILAARINPFKHFIQFGRHENRRYS